MMDPMERVVELIVLDDLLDSLDQTWSQLSERLAGLTVDEYLWEPTPGCWAAVPRRRGRGGSDRLFDLLGEGWGPYAESTVLALALHAQREVTHHGAEIALLRDLFRSRSS